MLTITVQPVELFDSRTNEFVRPIDKPVKLSLEHSLLSVKKWEAKWHKPFLDDKHEKTSEEMLDYIRCMTVTSNVNPEVYRCLRQSDVSVISEYISNPMTATVISEDLPSKGRSQGKYITAEVIYSWMVQMRIPPEYQKWHLNQLLMLIRVIGAESQTPKKKSQKQILAENKRLNAARRAKARSRG